VAVLWAVAWGPVANGFFVLSIPVLILAASLDPRRHERKQNEAAAILAANIRAEEKLAAMPVHIAQDGVTEISFKSLEFVPLADPKNPESGAISHALRAPPRIKAFDRIRVRITGYLLPTRASSESAREFLIVANRTTCCYGGEPRFCDYILGQIESESLPTSLDTPVSFEGTLHVSDVYANGYWSGLYSMNCTKIIR
jgi:hypothetical protein